MLPKQLIILLYSILMLQDANKTELFISKAYKIHKNRYDYSKVNYINAKTKITIICREH